MHRTGKKKLQEKTSNLLNAFVTVNSNLTGDSFREVAPEDLRIVDHVENGNILVYDVEVSDNGIVGELAQRS